MRFFVISDLHLGEELGVDKAKIQIRSLCGRIRADFPANETILFIVMGDVINASNTDAFDDARECLNCIRLELRQRTVKFEFVPGNHDLPSGDIRPFDRFIAEFGCAQEYGKKHAYSRIYENVNFIFADSNLYRDHCEPGKIDLEEIRNLIRTGSNMLFCHHGFEHDFGGGHDVIENGSMLLKEIKAMGIGFVFHGHTHRADVTISDSGIVEIGTGALLKDLHDMEGIQNQFTSGCIRNGRLLQVERYVVSKDGGAMFPKATIYPERKTFEDPESIRKVEYEPVPKYIARHVLPHTTAIAGAWERYFAKEKRLTLENAVREYHRILFLSDAGNGKSIELQNLVFSLKNSTFFPFLYKLKDYTGTPISELLPQGYGDILPHNLVLAFDGYDELTPIESERFVKELNAYVASNPNVHVVISSRSNFCKSESGDKSKTFPEFAVFDLCELTEEDRKAYLAAQDVDIEKFWKSAGTSGILGMLNNAFYLVEVCNLFKSRGDLPAKTELMGQLIELRFDIDDEKFLAHLEDQYHSFLDLLCKVAFAMQLMQKNQFDDRTEYQDLFNKDDRDLIKHSGLLVKEGSSWRFLHNNFREFLAARYLSQMQRDDVVAYISNGDGIKPSWVNTLGYLAGMELPWDLIGWIGLNAPNALVKFEPDRVDDAQRYEIFYRMFTYYEDRHLWFYDDLCDVEELAHFSQSYDSLVFLLERIKNPVHHMSQYMAVNILRHYHRGLYGMDKAVKECLLNVCRNFPQTRKDTCRLAMFALYQLNLYSVEITSELIALFGKSDVDYIRLGMYEYHIELCKEERWDLAASYAIAICMDQNADEWLRRVSLEYLYVLYGVGFIKNRILPSASGRFLNDIVSICVDMPKENLKLKFEAEYTVNPSADIQARLVTYGSDIAIRDYVDEIKRKRRIEDDDTYPSTPTNAVKTISDPRFLPLLGELIPVVCDPEFVDAEFSGLYNSLSDALMNCGKNDKDATLTMVEQYRIESNGQERAQRFCNHVIEEVRRNARRNSDQPLSLQAVKKLIMN